MTSTASVMTEEPFADGDAEELATRALLSRVAGVEDEALVTAARAGHSPSARALVNATDVTPMFAASVEEVEPSDALRARLLRSAQKVVRAEQPPPPPRALCEVLADQHSVGPVDEERQRRIAELHAGGALGGSPEAEDVDREIAALLERMAPFVPKGALFVSVVRGGQTIHRVHRGFPSEFGNVDVVPRFLSFCTHTVSADTTFVVHDTRREAFFRRSLVATKYGARSYVGVPLRVGPRADGPEGDLAVGALCAIQFGQGPSGEGRKVPATEVRFFEHCAKHAEALVAKRDASALVGDGVYTEPFFRRLLEIELARSRDAAALATRTLTVVDPPAGADGFYGRVGPRLLRLSVGAGEGAIAEPDVADVDAWISRAVSAKDGTGGPSVS